MAVLLAAHYAFIQTTMRNILGEYEKVSVADRIRTEAHNEEDQRRFARLEDVDRASAATLVSLENRQQQLERELAIVKERQTQVRMKLGMSP